MGHKYGEEEGLGWHDGEEADCETALLIEGQGAGHGRSHQARHGGKHSHMLARTLQADTSRQQSEQQQQQQQQQGQGGACTQKAPSPAEVPLRQQQQQQQQGSTSGMGGDEELDLLERSLLERSRAGGVRAAHTIGPWPESTGAPAPAGSGSAAWDAGQPPPHLRAISTMDSCSSLHTSQQPVMAGMRGNGGAPQARGGLCSTSSGGGGGGDGSGSSPGSPVHQQRDAGVPGLGGGAKAEGRGEQKGIEMLEVRGPSEGSGSGGKVAGGEEQGGGDQWGRWQGEASCAAAAAEAAAAAATGLRVREQGSAGAAAAALAGAQPQPPGAEDAEGWVQLDLEEGQRREEGEGGRGAPGKLAAPHEEHEANGQGPEGAETGKPEEWDEEPVVWYKNPQVCGRGRGHAGTLVRNVWVRACGRGRAGAPAHARAC